MSCLAEAWASKSPGMPRASSSDTKLWALRLLRRGPSLLLGAVLISISSSHRACWAWGEHLASLEAPQPFISHSKGSPLHLIFTEVQETGVGKPCSRKQLWVSGEGSQRAATCYLSHSHPLPNSLAHLSRGMVWLEYLMLMQAAFPPVMAKMYAPCPDTQLSTHGESTLKLGFSFFKPH